MHNRLRCIRQRLITFFDNQPQIWESPQFWWCLISDGPLVDLGVITLKHNYVNLFVYVFLMSDPRVVQTLVVYNSIQLVYKIEIWVLWESWHCLDTFYITNSKLRGTKTTCFCYIPETWRINSVYMLCVCREKMRRLWVRWAPPPANLHTEPLC